MTRLRTTDIAPVSAGLPEHDRYLRSVTGLTLAGVARRAAGGVESAGWSRTTFCIVPISAGQGILPGFCEAVRDVLRHVGFSARVASRTDRAGLAEARQSGNTVVMWADDDQFVAELPGGRQINNTEATARGYVTGLECMTGDLKDRPILLLGCGRLGRVAAGLLQARGARVTAFDPITRRALSLAAVADSLEEGLAIHDLIFLAADAANIVRSRHVTPAMRIAAPGMPCGATPAARRRLAGRLLHDALQMGVATMGFMAAMEKGM